MYYPMKKVRMMHEINVLGKGFAQWIGRTLWTRAYYLVPERKDRSETILDFGPPWRDSWGVFDSVSLA